MARTVQDALRWVDHGTKLAGDAIAALDEAAFDAPTGLPGWTRRHLVAHLAANADAVHNLVHWASSGEPTPMYASPEQRASEIEAGSRLPAAKLRAWFDRSAATLAAQMRALTRGQWDAQVVTAQGRTVPATETPWLRAREVMVHAVDIDTGLTFDDLPADFLRALGEDIATRRSGTPGGPALLVEPTDDPVRWPVRGPAGPITVTGTLANLVAYLAGRPAVGVRVASGDLPPLPPWL